MAGPGVSHEWQGKTDEIDFIKNDGGFFAVSLTLSQKNAEHLRTILLACLKNAKKHGKEDIEIIAHWGKRTKAAGDLNKGYRLRARIKQIKQ
jgi:hypothetical protein